MKYISNGSFRNLLYLYLFHNKISYLGILDLVKDDDFVKKLKLLSLSENPIGDVGILTMTQKFWLKLEILKLNGTGLTNIGIKHIGTAPMPNLKKLFIEDNKIDIKGVINTINGLRINKTQVIYLNEDERKKEKEKRKKEKEKRKKEGKNK